MGIRRHVVIAVLKRDFGAFFGNLKGYVFITGFIVATAFIAFGREVFFAANLADLSALNARFLWLPVIFIPLITMSTWAEERKLGTDELLLTLPVRDAEVVIGKYLAALAVYTVSLMFALSHVMVLIILGEPDGGLLLANYVGYWIVGAALIPLGMAASALSSEGTVAFVLGTLFCWCAVFAQNLLELLGGSQSRLVAGAGMEEHFRNFTYGVIALPDVLYFGLLAGVVLYVNMVLLGRRHWQGGRRGNLLGLHFSARTAALVVAAVAVSILAGRWVATLRLDTTAEHINSITRASRHLIRDLPGDRPVYVQAYISPRVPDEYVPTREDLLRMLREIDVVGGGRILVNIRDTEPHSQAAEEAEDRFEIKPRQVGSIEGGRISTEEVFLGVAMTSGPEEQVIGFLDRGLSAEYELVRTLRTVVKAERPKIGVLRTDAELIGSFDFQTYSRRPDWEIVTELKKQYDVVEVGPDDAVAADVDVLIAALPSSLTQEQMDNLEDYMTAGRPTLLLIDPLPLMFPDLSPSRPKRPQMNSPYGPRQPPGQKGNLNALLGGLGLAWQNDTIVWDFYNALPKLAQLPPEYVFVSKEAGGTAPFGPGDPTVEGISRLVTMFPGALTPLPSPAAEVKPLLKTGRATGQLSWHEILTGGMFGGMRFNEYRRHIPTGIEYVLGVRVTGRAPTPARLADSESPPVPAMLNAVVIADLDLISDQFFQLRREAVKDLQFDNVTFILNCVDDLAGDRSLIGIRNRQPRYRTLETIEGKRARFQKELQEEEEKAEEEAKKELDAAQATLDKKVEEIRGKTGLDEQSKEILLDQVQRAENRKLESKKAAIEDKKQERIGQAEEEMQQGIRRIENSVRLLAIVIPPLPAILVGFIIFLMQKAKERTSTPLSRGMRRN